MAALLPRSAAMPSLAKPQHVSCPMRTSRARAIIVRASSSKEDAVKALEQFGAGARASLATKDHSVADGTVQVMPLITRSGDSASGSIDGGGPEKSPARPVFPTAMCSCILR